MFPSSAKGCGCPFPANLSGRDAMNSLCWKCQPHEVKHSLEISPSSPKHLVLQGRKCPLPPSVHFPTGMLGTLQEWDPEKVQSCLVCKASDKEIGSNMLLRGAWVSHNQAQHRDICRFAKMRLNKYINFSKVSSYRIFITILPEDRDEGYVFSSQLVITLEIIQLEVCFLK